MLKSIIYILLFAVLIVPSKVVTSDTIAPKSPITIKAEKLALTIKIIETRGNYQVKGASGEIGAYQFMPSTYKRLSQIHFGTTTPMTDQNQDRLAYLEIKSLIIKGYSERDVFATWNQGNRGQCKSGINKYGVKYDSCAYIQKGLNQYSKL
jgi:hypothetical protein